MSPHIQTSAFSTPRSDPRRVLSRAPTKQRFEVEHFPTKAVTDVKGGGVGAFISRVHGERSHSWNTPTQPPTLQISSLRAISSPLCSLAVSRSPFFSCDRPCLTYISDDEQYAGD